MPISSILFPTDFSEASGTALTFVAGVAQEYDAQVHLLHVQETLPASLNFDRALLRDYASKLKERADELIDALDVPPSVLGSREVAIGTSVTEGILSFAEDLACDLIAVGSHGHNALHQALLGSVPDKLVRRATCPVLVVPTRPDTELSVGRFRTVVAPWDLSTQGAAALSYAARLHPTRCMVAHVFDSFAHPTFLYLGDTALEKIPQERRDEVTATLQRWIQQRDLGATFEPRLLEGHAHLAVTDLALKEDAGLIVCTPTGSGHGPKGLLGSATSKILRVAHCPVLVVRKGPAAP